MALKFLDYINSRCNQQKNLVTKVANNVHSHLKKEFKGLSYGDNEIFCDFNDCVNFWMDTSQIIIFHTLIVKLRFLLYQNVLPKELALLWVLRNSSVFWVQKRSSKTICAPFLTFSAGGIISFLRWIPSRTTCRRKRCLASWETFCPVRNRLPRIFQY